MNIFRKFKPFKTLLLLSAMLFALTGCDDDDDDIFADLTGNAITYGMYAPNTLDPVGVVTFSERDDNSTRVTIELNNTAAGNQHPAHIHMNSFAEGGSIVVSLNNVDGSNGSSVTEVTAYDDGTSVTYSELVNYDGHVNVHQSASNLSEYVAQGEVGSNALTSEFVTYDLDPVAVPDISGTATMIERLDGTTLAFIQLANTPDGGTHPAGIYTSTAAEGGDLFIDLSPVDGNTGTSFTDIEETESGDAILFDELILANGHLNVYLSPTDLTLVAQGDIGENALTGNTVTYDLNVVQNSGVSGTAEFAERVNGTALVTVMVDGTQDGDTHPMHIHNNSASEGGSIAVTLNSVDGTTGLSRTQVVEKDDGTAISYSELIGYDGYINIHQSPEDLATLLSQGNIGENAN